VSFRTRGGIRYRFSGLLVILFLLLPQSISFAGVASNVQPERLPRYQPRFYPFDGGEKAFYQASWNGIPVGSAEIHTGPLFLEGKKFYYVRVQARTWKYLEPIWKMRDSIESVFEARTLQPRRFIFRQRENRKKIDTTALFDPRSKKWKVERRQGSNVKEYEFSSQQTLDPIAAVYLARTLDLKVGDSLHLEVFGGQSRYLVDLHVAGKERITLGDREVEAFKIIPQVRNLNGSGYAGRMRQAVGWISADEKRTPLRMVSQVFIGSVYIEMVEQKS